MATVVPNTTADQQDDDLKLQQVFNVAVTVILPIIVTMGLSGNLLTLVVLSRQDFHRQVAYTYIRWMAVSDLLVITLMLPQLLVVNKNEHSTLAEAWYHAHIHLLLINSGLASSALFTVSLSIERCVAVWSAHRHNQLSTPTKAAVITVSIFIICFAMNLYLFWGQEVTEDSCPPQPQLDDNTTALGAYGAGASNISSPACRPNFKVGFSSFSTSKAHRAMQLLAAISLKLVPVLLVAGFNAAILVKHREVRRRRERMQGAASSNVGGTAAVSKKSAAASAQAARRRSADKRVTIMLLCVVVIFFTCVSPAAFQHAFFTHTNLESVGFKMFGIVADLLEITNSAANFYVYLAWSSDFRSNFFDMLREMLHLFPRINCDGEQAQRGGGGGPRKRGKKMETMQQSDTNLIAEEKLRSPATTTFLMPNNQPEHLAEYAKLKQTSPGPGEGVESASESEDDSVVDGEDGYALNNTRPVVHANPIHFPPSQKDDLTVI